MILIKSSIALKFNIKLKKDRNCGGGRENGKKGGWEKGEEIEEGGKKKKEKIKICGQK